MCFGERKMRQETAYQKKEGKIKKKSRVRRRKCIEAVLELGQCWTVAVYKKTLTALVMRDGLIEFCPSPILMGKFQNWRGKDTEK